MLLVIAKIGKLRELSPLLNNFSIEIELKNIGKEKHVRQKLTYVRAFIPLIKL
jgi:hypothetical protein